MSRFNQFTGYAGALKVNGVDSDREQNVLARVEPIINSWTVRCRLLAEQSGLAVVRKHLTTALFDADWSWHHGNETLTINIFPVPVTPEKSNPEEPKEEQKEEPFEPPGHPEPPEPDMPTPREIEQIQIANELPPQPPEFIKCLVLLFDDNRMVVYDMRSLEKDMLKQKPLVEPSELRSSWHPYSTTQIENIRSYYFGNMVQSRYNDTGANTSVPNKVVLPTTLQMTNSLKMGAVAIADLTFDEGIFAVSKNYTVFRVGKGFKYNAPLEALAQIGDVGTAGGFPALMATDNMIYACTQMFTINESDGTLSQYGSDVWGIGNILQTTYGISPAAPLVPNFIDSSCIAHFDIGYPFATNQPSMGGLQLCSNGTTETKYNYIYGFVGPIETSVGTGEARKPALTQENGIDKLDAEHITVTQTNSLNVDSSIKVVTAWGSYTGTVARAGWNFTQTVGPIFVPYPPPGKVNFYDQGDAASLETIFGQTFGPFKFIYGSSFPIAANTHEVMNGFMQVSNGKHNLQGFAIHSTTYDTSTKTWPIDSYHFYLDGKDFASTLEAICETTRDKIQYAFMDVPYYSVQTIKLAPKT